MKRSILKGLSAVFSWRKGRTRKEGGVGQDLGSLDKASHPARWEQVPADNDSSEKDWLYVGNDEEGTPIFLDKARTAYRAGSVPVQVWLKHVPAETSDSFEQAGKYLKETGHDWKSFHHIEQLIELDLDRDLIADLVLDFFDRNGRLIEHVQFHEETRRPLGAEAVYSAIKDMITRLNAQAQHRPEPPGDEEPSVDEKIGLKLQEINDVLDAFDTCGGSDDTSAATPSKPRSSR